MNDIRRNGGQFLWRQIYNARRAGVRIIYGAMWDEYVSLRPRLTSLMMTLDMTKAPRSCPSCPTRLSSPYTPRSGSSRSTLTGTIYRLTGTCASRGSPQRRSTENVPSPTHCPTKSCKITGIRGRRPDRRMSMGSRARLARGRCRARRTMRRRRIVWRTRLYRAGVVRPLRFPRTGVQVRRQQ